MYRKVYENKKLDRVRYLTNLRAVRPGVQSEFK